MYTYIDISTLSMSKCLTALFVGRDVLQVDECETLSIYIYNDVHVHAYT